MLFDAIEFDEAIATCDVLYDLACPAPSTLAARAMARLMATLRWAPRSNVKCNPRRHYANQRADLDDITAAMADAWLAACDRRVIAQR